MNQKVKHQGFLQYSMLLLHTLKKYVRIRPKRSGSATLQLKYCATACTDAKVYAFVFALSISFFKIQTRHSFAPNFLQTLIFARTGSSNLWALSLLWVSDRKSPLFHTQFAYTPVSQQLHIYSIGPPQHGHNPRTGFKKKSCTVTSHL
jgi:hypothetical protein